jgi:polyisoprenoid-binding protein YceI
MTTAAALAPDTTTATETQALPRWTLDASHSNVSFSVRHMMISNVRGEFGKVTGQAGYDPQRPEASELEVEIDVASISTREEKRDAHLRSPDFFDTANFPSMTFKSRGVRRRGQDLEVTGDLTIRGTTRPLTLTITDITPVATDPWGNRRVGASARGKLRRSDFGMRWNAALEAGGVLVGDEVTINIEAELVSQ